jgi:hypothetical protein
MPLRGPRRSRGVRLFPPMIESASPRLINVSSGLPILREVPDLICGFADAPTSLIPSSRPQVREALLKTLFPRTPPLAVSFLGEVPPSRKSMITRHRRDRLRSARRTVLSIGCGRSDILWCPATKYVLREHVRDARFNNKGPCPQIVALNRWPCFRPSSAASGVGMPMWVRMEEIVGVDKHHGELSRTGMMLSRGLAVRRLRC